MNRDFASLSEGDIIKTSRTLAVKRRTERFLWLEDVQNGARFSQPISDEALANTGTLRFELQVKAARQFKVGDIIDSRAGLADLPEGSVVSNATGADLLVRSGGTMGAQGGDVRILPFGDGYENAPYTVRYLP